MINNKNRIILALDVDNEDDAIRIISELKSYVGYFKIGLGFLYNIKQPNKFISLIIKEGGRVFLDCKLHDIPNTVAAASRGITRQSVDMFNLHLSGGYDMIRASIEAIKDEANKISIDRTILLGVSLLTSISRSEMNDQLRIPGSVEEHVSAMAKLADKAGIDGIIASPLEIEIIKNSISREMLIVTPGIRPLWASSNDQKRSMQPSEAIAKGATHIVIGRPITNPPAEIGSPTDAINKIIQEL